MLEGLDQIDWYALGHAYGDASDVPNMLRALASPNKTTRARAWDDLFGSVRHQGDIYNSTPRVVPFLVELLADPATPDKAQFLENLCGFAPDFSYWNPYCGEATNPNDKFSQQTREAIEEGMPVYAALLGDPDAAVRTSAARLLTVCFRYRDKVARTLREHIPGEKDSLVRAIWILQLAVLNRPADGRFLAGLIQSERAPLVRFAAALAQVHLLPVNPPTDAIAIIERGTRPGSNLLARLPADEWVVSRALDALARQPDAGVRILLKLRGSPTVAIRKEAIHRLSLLNPCPPEAIRGMVQSLADESEDVRSWTAFLLGEIGDSAITYSRLSGQAFTSEALEEELGRVAPAVVAGFVGRLTVEKDATVRGAIGRALKGLAPWAEQAAPALRSITSKNPDAREALGEIEAFHRAKPTDLIRLTDGDGKVAWMAGRILVRVGRERPEVVVPLLTKRLTEWPAAVEKAAKLLGELGPLAVDALPALRAAIHHTYQGARNAAADAIRSIDVGTSVTDQPNEAEIRRQLGDSAPPELTRLITRLLDDTSTGGQWGALWEITQMGVAAQPAIPFVRAAMGKKWLLHDAAGALARLDPESIRPMLPDLLRAFETARLDGDFQERALPFLVYLGPELQPDAVALLLRSLPEVGKRPRTAARMIPSALGYLGSADPNVLLPLVVRLLETRWESEGVDIFCPTTPVLKFLKYKGTQYARAVPAVAAKLKNKNLTPLVLETLSRIGSWATVLPFVEQSLASEDSTIREAAATCVRRLGKSATLADVPALQSALAHRSDIVTRAAKVTLDRLGISE